MTTTIRPPQAGPPRSARDVTARAAVLTLALSVAYGGCVAVQQQHWPTPVTWTLYLTLVAVGCVMADPPARLPDRGVHAAWAVALLLLGVAAVRGLLAGSVFGLLLGLVGMAVIVVLGMALAATCRQAWSLATGRR